MVFVDGLRGLAALGVVLYHLELDGGRASQLGDRLPHWMVELIQRGGVGVPVFFVLSGYVMAHSVRTARVDRHFFGSFMRRRIVRLTPSYYTAIVLSLVVAALGVIVKGGAFMLEDAPMTVARALSHLFYLQAAVDQPQISSVFWTLCYEMAFYLVFVLLLWLAAAIDGRLGRQGVGAATVFAFAGCASIVLALGHMQGEMLPFPWVRGFFTFLLGVFAYWYTNGSLRSWTLVTYMFAVLATGFVTEMDVRVISVATALALVVASHFDKMHRWLGNRPVQFLGTVSYSLYLTHSLVFTAAFYVASAVGEGPGAELGYVVVGVLGSLVTAAVLWQVVERRSIASSRRPRASPVVSSVVPNAGPASS